MSARRESVARGGRGALGEAGTTIVETLVAALLASLVLGAALTLLRTHGTLSRALQSELAARSSAAWALGVVLRDVALAGADPMRAGVVALRSAAPVRLELDSDLDGDGAIDPSSAERLTIEYVASGGGRLVRWVGRQSMTIASPLPSDGFRLRYFAADGSEIVAAGGALDDAGRAGVRRVRVELAVKETPERPRGEVRLQSASAVRARTAAGGS